jgi:hypothetical protein
MDAERLQGLCPSLVIHGVAGTSARRGMDERPAAGDWRRLREESRRANIGMNLAGIFNALDQRLRSIQNLSVHGGVFVARRSSSSLVIRRSSFVVHRSSFVVVRRSSLTSATLIRSCLS